MIKNIVAQRYSGVLVASYAKKDIAKLRETMESLLNLFQTKPDIKEFFTSPVVKRKDKLEVMELLADKSGLDKKMHNFFKLLIENNRIFFLDEIFAEIINAIHKKMNINYFNLETARKLDDKTIQKIKKFVKTYVGGTIKFKYNVNKDLVGGFFVYNDDLALNASIKNNFEIFVKEL